MQFNIVLFSICGGGSGEYYLPWKLNLMEEINVIPVQYPGRSYRRSAPMYSRADAFVEDFIEQIKPFIETKKTYGFFGHSMGGYLTYSITKSLQHLGLPLPSVAFISSTPTPDLWAGQRSVIGMSEAEFNDIYMGLGGIDDAFLNYPEFMDMQMKILRQDIEMVETCLHQDNVKLDVPLISLGAEDDHHVSAACIENWTNFTSQQGFAYPFKGGHFYLNAEQEQVFNIINVYARRFLAQPVESC